ncbi:MAG: tetratricopeptide repeat protein [Candidatus Thermoplasmatota archaeon]|nr:tetratricopeptide repeat protein [Euryarchaeota archaeon]MBU4032613.1 tetratricopeptide repeat protein [Candidatus Thermoplasmatota archaeon]MBU4072175.1 tetratricopeptide repeat protein [Candidatus Thermoplasmatota archaeon]MBU4145023.1 tetratricopeptide repeat protein [Candidatus Thermoplasmatota archaeon]MBU4592037.1 tetratricopeptide repeat protein [Candidatus Thermoplasmatota archaeon]
MGERALTVGDRIIVHLFGFGRFAEEFECPEDMCQSGISTATGKSRAHITLELNRMKEAGLVMERNAHVKGAKSRRKTYLLTPTGLAKFSEINNYLESLNIEIVENEISRFVTGNGAAEYLRAIFNLSKIMAVDRVLASGGILVVSQQEGAEQPEPRMKYLPPKPDDFQPRREMKTLISMLADDKTNTVILLGIPGMGKTTMLAQLAGSLEPGSAVMYRKLYSYDSAVSILTDMGDFLDDNGYPHLRRFMANPILFDLSEAGYMAKCAFSGKKLVVIIDDYEQAPCTLMPLLSMLTEMVNGSGSGLIIASSKRGDFYSLKNLALDRTVREVSLGPMEPEAAGKLLGSDNGNNKEYLKMAGGHPLTLKLLASGVGATTLAGYVEDEVLGKDTELSKMCRFVSVIRKPFLPDDLELGGFKAADQIRHNLVFEPQPGGGYLLHSAISSIMLAATGKRMLKELHLMAAEFYEKTETGTHEILHHLIHGDSMDKARNLMLEKGEELLSTGNPEELADAMELVLWEKEEKPQVKLLATRIFDHAGKWDRAEKVAREILKESPETQEAIMAGIIHANILSKTGDPKAALKVLDSIPKNRMKQEVRARVYYARASTLRRLGQNREALEACEKAIATAEKTGNGVMRGQCLMENAMIMSASGKHREALDNLKSAMALFSEKDSLPDLIRCRINMGMVMRSLEMYDEAAETLEMAVKMAEEAGLNRFRAHGLVNLTDLLNRKKEFKRSVKLSHLAIDIFSGLGDPLMQAAAMFNLCTASAGNGRKKEAIATMEKALSILEKKGLVKSKGSWISECADILRGMGEDELAKKIIKKYGG